MTYQEWEAKQSFSGVSPEASSAEAAWNAALKEAKRLVSVAASKNLVSVQSRMSIDKAISSIETDYRTEFH